MPHFPLIHIALALPNLGETFALVTAVTWSLAVILFKKSGETAHPIGLNLFKNFVAMVLILPTMWLFGETLFRPAGTDEYLLLLVSGGLGIGVADTLFFMSLNRLGAGLSAIVDCLYSPFIIGLSMFFLGESLNFWQAIGVVMIISAVLTATSRQESSRLGRKNLWLGILFGALAMGINAIGIVIVKPLLDRSPLLWVTEYRLLGGMLVLAVVLLFHPRRRPIVGSLIHRSGWKYTISAAFVGTYLSLIFWLIGMKFTQASIAASLNQTSNIFVFIFAAWFLREPINRTRVIGIILGVAGALIVTFT